MKLRSLMTAICVLATANMVSAAPFAYVANSGTRNVTVIDTADNSIKATVPLPDTQQTLHPYAYGVTVGASGQYAYVGLQDTNEVVVIDTAKAVGTANAVVKRIGLGADSPGGLAVNAAETRLYVSSNKSNTLIVIDISGSGAAEVGRVTVDDATISSPDGVVLNPAGDKAYVASTTTGNVAEISLNEAANVYTRLSVIPVGAQPVGLALSSDGNKLYASSLAGAVTMIDTASKAVTNLTVGAGTVSVAISPDNSKVYAPSNSLDQLYVIDAAANPNVVLGTQYPIAAGPFGSSITGEKLYLTMNTASAGETVKVFNTSTNNVDATINLPAGAKPTSLGNFIGPVFPYTITASDDNTNCVISPEGTIPVNNKGRSFTSTAITGACEVKIDSVSVGQPSGYTFTDVTANHTISATPIAGTFYTLTTDWTPQAEGRCLKSDVAGISCSSKSAQYLSGAVVKLSATPGFSASNWAGDCLGTSGGTCTLTMNGNKTATAVINLGGGTGPIFNVTKASYYQTIAELTAGAADGDVVKISTSITSGTTTGTPGIKVVMSSQWLPSDYSALDTVKQPLTLTITDVGVIAGVPGDNTSVLTL